MSRSENLDILFDFCHMTFEHVSFAVIALQVYHTVPHNTNWPCF
jgi:hypothetical protein